MVITDTMSSIEWTRDEIQRLLSWDGKRSIQAKDVYAETIGCVPCVVVQFDKSVYNKSWCKEDLYALDAGLDMVNVYNIRAKDDVVEVVYRKDINFTDILQLNKDYNKSDSDEERELIQDHISRYIVQVIEHTVDWELESGAGCCPTYNCMFDGLNWDTWCKTESLTLDKDYMEEIGYVRVVHNYIKNDVKGSKDTYVPEELFHAYDDGSLYRYLNGYKHQCEMKFINDELWEIHDSLDGILEIDPSKRDTINAIKELLKRLK